MLWAVKNTHRTLDAGESINDPCTCLFINSNSASGASPLAKAAENTIFDITDDLAFAMVTHRRLHRRIANGLGLGNERLECHSAQLECSHGGLPFRAADAGVNSEHNHVHIGHITALKRHGHTGDVLRGWRADTHALQEFSSIN